MGTCTCGIGQRRAWGQALSHRPALSDPHTALTSRERTHAVNGFDATFFLDYETGARTPLTKAHVGCFVRLADALPHIDITGVQGIPQDVPQAGAASPATLAGNLVQHNAQILSGIVLSQVLSPGHPVVYCNAHTLFNMREGNPCVDEKTSRFFDNCIAMLVSGY